MAPEQVEGAEDIDARADVYALGALLFEVFTGRRPWIGDAPIAVAAARLVHPPPDPRALKPDLPTRLAEIILRCMARRRVDRFADVGAIGDELSTMTLPAPSTTRAAAPPRPSAVPPSNVAVAPATDKTVAVLPFANTGDAADAYLAAELSDDLVDALSMTPRLKVCARSVVARAKSTSGDAREMGRELGVQVVVEGAVRRGAGRVRVTARLVSIADGFQLWAKRFDRPEQEVLAVNDEVATAIASALTVDLALPARAAPNDPVAVELYLRARHEYRKFWPDAMTHSVALFEQALARSPDDPIILAGAALAHGRLAFFRGETIDRAVAVAERAVELAPALGDSHLALASVVFQLGDTPRAVHELCVAIGKNPGLAEAHASLGRILLEVGESEEGARRIHAALQIDAAVPLAYASLAREYALEGRWADVDELIERAERSDGLASGWTARARTALWRGDIEAVERLAGAMKTGPDYGLVAGWLLRLMRDRQFPDDPRLEAAMREDRGGARRRRAFFLQLEVEAAVYLGVPDRACDALERCTDAGLIDLAWLDRCAMLDPVREMPKFRTQRARVKARADEILAAYRAG
jgi:serine/threonine-protein kinase